MNLPTHHIKRILRWSFWAACGWMVLLAVLHFVLPVWINADSFKSRLLALTGQAMPGRLDFDQLRPTLLPLPGLIVTKAQWTLQQRYHLQVERVTVTPKVLPLFLGRIEVEQVRIDQPDLSVQLSSAKTGSQGKGGPPPGDLSATIRKILSAVPDGANLYLNAGRIALTRDATPVERWQDLFLHLAAADGRLQGEMSGQSYQAGPFQISAHLDRESLDGRLQVDLPRLTADHWLALLPLPPSLPSVQGTMALQVGVEADGLRTFQAAFLVTAPQLILSRGSARNALAGLSVGGSAQWSPDSFTVNLDRLSTSSPRLNGGVTILRKSAAQGDTPQLRLTVQSRDSDASGFRDLILFLVKGADQWVLMDIIRGGTVEQMTLASEGPSWRSLGRLTHLEVSGKAKNAHIVIPGPSFDLTAVDGQWQLADGRLTVQATHATMGATTARKGDLLLDLGASPLQMDLAVDLDVDLAQLPSVLRQVVSEPRIVAELDRIGQVRGTAQGQLTVNGGLNAPKVAVTVKTIDALVPYDRLPAPLRVTQGQVHYGTDGIRIERSRVAMADSRFDGLGGRITFGQKGTVDVTCAEARVVSQQLFPWLKGLTSANEWTRSIEAVDGVLLFKDLQVHYAVSEPAAWQVLGKGAFNAVTIASRTLPGPLAVNRGRFQLGRSDLSFADLQVRMTDSALHGDAVIKGYRAPQRRIGASVSGTIGRHGIAWLYERFDLDPSYLLRGPVAIGQMTLGGQAGEEIRMAGDFGLPDDVKLDVALHWKASTLTIERLDLADDRSRAQATFGLDTARRIVDLSFRGNLAAGTLARLWDGEPLVDGWMHGDLEGRVVVDEPRRSTLSGKLEAGDIHFPASDRGSVALRHLDLTAGEEHIALKTLVLDWRQQPITLSGDVNFSDDAVALDLMLTADALDLTALEPREKKEPLSDEQEQGRAFPHIKGQIGLQIGVLTYKHLRWDGVRADLQLVREGFELDVTQADLCGIATVGQLGWTPRGITLTLTPRASRQTLQYTGGCLTGADTTERISGIFDVDGQVTTAGRTGEQLVRNLSGTLALRAVDGRISNAGRVGTLTNILSYLQLSRIFKDKPVDLSKDDFVYKTIAAQVMFDQGLARLTDANITSEVLNMVAEGTVDLMTKQTHLTVLVSPLTTVDAVVRNIPIVGKILQGTLVALPVEVKGPLADPTVVTLSPKAIGSRLTGILERTLKAPFQLVEFERPPAAEENKDTKDAPLP